MPKLNQSTKDALNEMEQAASTCIDYARMADKGANMISTAPEYRARAAGWYAAIEVVLHRHNAYKGFRYLDDEKRSYTFHG